MDELTVLLDMAARDVARLHAERDAARAALAGLLATEPLALSADGAHTTCVYCVRSAPVGASGPHPHDSDCPWARGREARGG